MIDWMTMVAAEEPRRWNDSELARRMGVAPSIVSDMWWGRRGVLGEHWTRFCVAAGVDMPRALRRLADLMEDQAKGVAYDDDGKYARKVAPALASGTPPTSRPPR